MLRKLRPRSAYDVIALLALFVALGGSAYAAATITGSDVVDESLTGNDIKGTNGVGSTQGVNGTITGADIAGQKALSNGQPLINGSINTYDIQDRGLRGADLELGTVGKSELKAAQAWQNVQTPDAGHCQPPADGYFSCVNFGGPNPQWRNDSSTTNNDASFYKDPYGVVHLKGIVCFQGNPNGDCSNTGSVSRVTIFQLPVGYRPAKDWSFHTATAFGDGLVSVGADGHVDYINGSYAGTALDGIDFRACGEPGSEACPGGSS
jgi:hypothetical protein